MTVKELITELSKYDPSFLVRVHEEYFQPEVSSCDLVEGKTIAGDTYFEVVLKRA